MHARPKCPEGYYLYYAKGQQHEYSMVWIMASDLLSEVGGRLNRKVAMLQEMDGGETYLAFITARGAGCAMQNDDPQALVTAVCTYDRLTTTKG